MHNKPILLQARPYRFGREEEMVHGTIHRIRKTAGRLPQEPSYFKTRALLRSHSVGTVCAEAGCPNRWECYSRGTVTVLIMGKRCTRACSFCGIARGLPEPLDPGEPARVARMAGELGIRHLVITSVARDDIPDMGASHFREAVAAVKMAGRQVTVEALVPDFGGEESSISTVVEGGCDILSHNMETARRLFPYIRPSYDYDRSLAVLVRAGEMGATTKSGMMLGLGERTGEARECIRHIREAGCSWITIGQYLRPTKRHPPVAKFYNKEEFEDLADYARSLGFRYVASAPRVRSSYRGDCLFR